MTQEEDGPAPEVNGHAEEVEEKEAVKSEEVKEKEAESQSTTSADTEVLVTHSVTSLHTPLVHILEDKVDSGSAISLLVYSRAGSQMMMMSVCLRCEPSLCILLLNKGKVAPLVQHISCTRASQCALQG